MVTILQLFSELSTGGGVRAALALAKYSARQGNYRHLIGQFRAAHVGQDTLALAREYGIEVLPPAHHPDFSRMLESFDIVQYNWWNSPVGYEFMQRSLPPMRLMGWFHIGGQVAPQILTDNVIDFFDLPVACSPYTFEAPAFKKIRESKSKPAAMAYGAADFERLAGISPRKHESFNVGYIGTVHYLKMHPDYVKMSASIDIPNVRFVVCGTGGSENDIREKAAALGLSQRFDVRGYVNDVKSVIEELDVYGYPLCSETYAASEVNLQEVMYAGIPAVVFPHGGVKHLIQHNQTGLIVNSAEEYKQAIEYLYQHPQERQRLGQNAKRYAEEVFGSENSAKVFNALYQEIMQRPKSLRQLRINNPSSSGEALTGAALFAESLGSAGADFWSSLRSENSAEVLIAEERIGNSNELLRTNGILQYANYFEKDPHLRLWVALCCMRLGVWPNAASQITQAIQLGLNHWRMFWYLAQVSKNLGELNMTRQLLEQLVGLVPEFDPAKRLLNEVRA